jgi:hypothetical protein
MSLYTFMLAGPRGPLSTSALGPTEPGSFNGVGDMLLDPVKLDYVRTANGEWQQTYDSRTQVLIRLSIRLGHSPFDPSHGTAIADLLLSGDLNNVDILQSETLRVGNDLHTEGVLSDLLVTVRDANGQPLLDDRGRNIVRTQWRDLASGEPITEAFTPR